jgi:hypothetical protein
MEAKPGAARIEVAHFEMYSRGQQGVFWRLLSANNRDSGQSGLGFPDADACRASIDRMLSLLGELRPIYTLTPDHRWHWTLALGDEVLARSSRSFDRRLRCVAASQWFLRAAPNATIRAALRVVRAVLPDDATVQIARPFTPLGQPHRPDLGSPKGSNAGSADLSDRDFGHRGHSGRPGARDRGREGR